MRIINTTERSLNFVKGVETPYSLQEVPTDLITIQPSEIVYAQRTPQGFVVTDEEFQKLLNLVEAYKDDAETTIIYVSQPVAQRFASEKGTYKVGNVYVGLPVTATVRGIKPPVSIYGAVSVIEKGQAVPTEIVDVAGNIINLSVHPLNFVFGDTVLPPIPVYQTLNVGQKWEWKKEGEVSIYKMGTFLPEEAEKLLDEIIHKAEAEGFRAVVYVSFMALKTIAKSGYPTEGKYHIIVSPFTETREGRTVAIWGKGQRVIPKPAVKVEGDKVYIVMSDTTTVDEIRELLLQTGREVFKNKAVILPAIRLTDAVIYLIQELKAYTKNIKVR